ncbi:MAG: Nif3-like dinuclear metal center hexameric protein [Metamycoplasmataceae bacterium]
MKINNQKELIKILEKEFPLKSQEPWDFSGFSFTSKKEKNLKVMISLDADKNAILKAIKNNVSIIIAHHPFCFAPTKREAIKIDQSKRELFDLAKKHNISIYSLHTNFDINKNGTHHYLLKRLGLLTKKIDQHEFSTIIKYTDSFDRLVKLLKEKLKINFVLSNWDKSKNDKVGKIYFGPGSGDIYEFMKYNKINNCDLLVTSDIKWNEQVVLQNAGINYVIISHKSEEVFIDGIYEFIKNQVAKDIEIILDRRKDLLKKY